VPCQNSPKAASADDPLRGTTSTKLMCISLYDIKPPQPCRHAQGAQRHKVGRAKAQKALAGPTRQLKQAPHHQKTWWVEEDLNLRPHAYQACALTT
jgi:hypothetical protein